MNSQHTIRPNLLIILCAVAFTVLFSIDRSGQLPLLRLWTTRFYSWVLLISAFGLLLGVANVIWIHMRRIQLGQQEWLLSLVMLATLSLIIFVGLADVAGVMNPLLIWSFENVIAPLQATLFALLAFFLATAAYRYLRINRTGGSWVLVGALLMLVMQMPAAQTIWQPALGTSRSQEAFFWLIQEPVMAALRGMLLGSSVAMLIVGLHFLVGRNR